MKLCQTCQAIIADEHNFCPNDGEKLATDMLATALQESLGAKYSLTKLIGTGSMGAVYRAQHQSLDEVAIKVMLGTPGNQKLSERFLREARALRKLRHQHSVLVYDLERSATGLTYMVMEMVEGRSLRDELKERGHLPLEEALTIAEAACDALQAAHERGIIHRDLKPDNILLAEERTEDGSRERIIKIADFGIVKLRGTRQGGVEVSMQLTNHGTPIGTPFYMSPEQWFGDGPGFTALDGRTDIYSLACTLYEMLAGRPPFLGQTTDELCQMHLKDEARPLSAITSRVPEAVSRVIMRALEKDRDLRPASAEEFAAELRRAYNESVAEVKQGAPETSHAKREPLSDREAATKQNPKLQKTEEAVPFIKNWSLEEAQQAIEQVRQRPVPVPPTMKQPVVKQPAAERPAEKRTKPRPEPPPAAVKATPVAVEAELKQTLIIERKPKPATVRETAPESAREKCKLTIAQVGTRRIAVHADEADAVVTGRAPIPLPYAPKAVLGVVGVRGRMLTLLDPLALLDEGSETATNAPPAFIIPLRGDEQLALAVESVSDAIEIYQDQIALPDHSSDTSAIRGVVHHEHGPIVVLETAELFDIAMHGAERRRRRTS
ncbi:MAG: eukaryotic-like serine/threonine-protein kinase [Acidobacteriota bacterium]|jgi:serine/threonine protein kinase/chemotaxis signal transduction protein|nr:eukaryotic-like serine/threonine-protein kinase [Acidobacteriota bacterium]